MAYIGRDVDKISNVEVLDNITFDGSSSYTLQKGGSNFTPSSANTLLVSIDGVVQAGNFTVSGSTIDFGTAVAGTSTCNFILHYGIGLITTPADGTVTTAKLTGGLTVTHAIGSASSPSITFDSDSNTGIFSPTADTIAFTKGGTEAMRIDSSGKILASQGTNWVGTVAESATSSVIEEGSNANGNFTKFADGTMICYTTKSITHSTLANNTYTVLSYTLPISFVGTPTCIVSGAYSTSGTLSIQRAVEIYNHDGFSWGSIWFYKTGSTTTQASRISLTAIGRWY
jgi:hypothetical protein